MPSRRSTKAAFTLLEIAIALSVLLLIAAFAWPALEGRITAAAMPESAARVRDLMGQARNVAMEETRRVRIRFAPNEQQPYIEIEEDPILLPGAWSELDMPWAQDAMADTLLEGVNVHSVRIGRPEFTKPISLNETPQLDEESDSESFSANDEEDALDESEGTENFDAGSAQSSFDDADENIDEDRPLIVFESDGSTAWAMLVISRAPLDEELEDEDERLWVIVDGRTGIPSVRKAYTDEQLRDDPDGDIYVVREDLYLPDLTDLGRLSFKSTGFGGKPGLDEDGDGIPDDVGEDGLSGDDLANAIDDAANGGGDGGGKGGNDAGDDPLPPELEDSLNNSDLSDAERENIRNALNGQGDGGFGPRGR